MTNADAKKHRTLVVGALGRMGERVRAVLSCEPSLTLSAALEMPGHPELGREVESGVRVTDDAKAAFATSEVAIDFATPAATLLNLRAAADAGVAYVTGTTGFSTAELQEIESLAARIPVVHAANFSVSVNVLAWLVEQAARKLGSVFDAELFEMHHSAKRDAPSGTALRLAKAVADGRDQNLEVHLVLERAGDIGPRPENAIGVQTLRAGDCPGEHTVLYVGQGERLELSHRASTRDHFARGAVRTAAWLVGRPPGFYRLEDGLGL